MPNNTPNYVRGDTTTFQFAADTNPFIRVYIDSNGKAAIAGAGVESVGVCWGGAVDISEDDRGDVRFDQVGTQVYVADGAISVGDEIYPAASGKVSATAVGSPLGVAVSAATADGDYIHAVPHNSPAASLVEFVEETGIDHSDFTDGGGAAGTYDMTQIPARSLVLGWEADVTEAFTGDSSATMQVGTSSDADRFSALTTGSVFTTGQIGVQSPASGANSYCAAATTPRITVTGGADWGNIAAGTMDVRIAVLRMNA